MNANLDDCIPKELHDFPNVTSTLINKCILDKNDKIKSSKLATFRKRRTIDSDQLDKVNPKRKEDSSSNFNVPLILSIA
jgi:hypothetical protein